jgi:hypothetical protein
VPRVLSMPAVVVLLGVSVLWMARPVRSAGDKPKDAPGTVKAFYTYHFAHDMGLTEKSLLERRRWLSPELHGLLLYERRRKTPQDEAPYLNGDPFTDSQEYPAAFRVGAASVRKTRASVEVHFTWKEKGRFQGARTSIVRLARQGNEWRINDFISEEGRSLLRQLQALKQKDDRGTPP